MPSIRIHYYSSWEFEGFWTANVLSYHGRIMHACDWTLDRFEF
jgi:hypothetical protein